LEQPPYVNIYGLSQAAGVITEAVLYRGSRMENAEHMSTSGLLAGKHFPTTLLHGISRALPLETNVLHLIYLVRRSSQHPSALCSSLFMGLLISRLNRCFGGVEWRNGNWTRWSE